MTKPPPKVKLLIYSVDKNSLRSRAARVSGTLGVFKCAPPLGAFGFDAPAVWAAFTVQYTMRDGYSRISFLWYSVGVMPV